MSPLGPPASDAALALRIRRGDERAFEELFARYREPLHRYCWSLTGSSEDAEEALQTTMLNAHGALSARAIPDALRPWLYRVARNASLNLVRDRPRWSSLDPHTPDPRPEPPAVSDERDRLRRLRADLGALEPRPRTALLLRELAGLSHREIAETLGGGADAATAKRLIHEAREALHEIDLGRDLPCADVRRVVSDGDGRVLRARRVRSHLRSCDGCAGFRAAIDRRGSDLAAIALAPALASGSAAVLAGGSAAGTAGGLTLAGGSGAGGIAALVGAGGVGLKLAAISTVVVIGGGAAVLPAAISSGAPDPAPRAVAAATPAAATPAVAPQRAALPAVPARVAVAPTATGEPVSPPPPAVPVAATPVDVAPAPAPPASPAAPAETASPPRPASAAAPDPPAPSPADPPVADNPTPDPPEPSAAPRGGQGPPVDPPGRRGTGPPAAAASPGPPEALPPQAAAGAPGRPDAPPPPAGGPPPARPAPSPAPPAPASGAAADPPAVGLGPEGPPARGRRP